MIISYSAVRIRALVLSVTLVVTMAAAPGAQAGFLDDLFGGTQQPAQPSYNYEPQQPASLESEGPVQRPRIKKVARETPPVRQKTTDLMLDKTLHPGDAVMMKDGMHIYSGGDGSRHVAKQFVPIDHSKAVSSKTRAALIAMDTTRTDALNKGTSPDTIASGRSAAVSTPISNGFKITDARGQSVRYVGP